MFFVLYHVLFLCTTNIGNDNADLKSANEQKGTAMSLTKLDTNLVVTPVNDSLKNSNNQTFNFKGQNKVFKDEFFNNQMHNKDFEETDSEEDHGRFDDQISNSSTSGQQVNTTQTNNKRKNDKYENSTTDSTNIVDVKPIEGADAVEENVDYIDTLVPDNKDESKYNVKRYNHGDLSGLAKTQSVISSSKQNSDEKNIKTPSTSNIEKQNRLKIFQKGLISKVTFDKTEKSNKNDTDIIYMPSKIFDALTKEFYNKNMPYIKKNSNSKDITEHRSVLDLSSDFTLSDQDSETFLEMMIKQKQTMEDQEFTSLFGNFIRLLFRMVKGYETSTNLNKDTKDKKNLSKLKQTIKDYVHLTEAYKARIERMVSYENEVQRVDNILALLAEEMQEIKIYTNKKKPGKSNFLKDKENRIRNMIGQLMMEGESIEGMEIKQDIVNCLEEYDRKRSSKTNNITHTELSKQDDLHNSNVSIASLSESTSNSKTSIEIKQLTSSKNENIYDTKRDLINGIDDKQTNKRLVPFEKKPALKKFKKSMAKIGLRMRSSLGFKSKKQKNDNYLVNDKNKISDEFRENGDNKSDIKLTKLSQDINKNLDMHSVDTERKNDQTEETNIQKQKKENCMYKNEDSTSNNNETINIFSNSSPLYHGDQNMEKPCNSNKTDDKAKNYEVKESKLTNRVINISSSNSQDLIAINNLPSENETLLITKVNSNSDDEWNEVIEDPLQTIEIDDDKNTSDFEISKILVNNQIETTIIPKTETLQIKKVNTSSDNEYSELNDSSLQQPIVLRNEKIRDQNTVDHKIRLCGLDIEDIFLFVIVSICFGVIYFIPFR